MSDPQVLVIGAGPTGLVMALFLAHHGIPVRIIEKNSGPGLASRALVVHARTLEFYAQLGFADEFISQGIKVETIHLRDGKREVATLTLKDMGKGLSPYPFVLGFPQDDHEKFLVDKLHVAGITVEWNTELTHFTQDQHGVRATFTRAGAEEAIEVAYLCGCDGARSHVREILALGFDGGTYAHHYYVADVKLRSTDNANLNVTLGANAFALMLPVRSSGMMRLIGIAPDSLDDKHTLVFEDVQPSAEQLLGITVDAVNWFSTYRVHHRVASHFQVGRCFIAGDAGHIHSPVGGQGMNTGIGDAVNLSWKLAHVLTGRARPSLLETYEAERITFARLLVATTDQAFRVIVSDGIGGRLFRRWLVPALVPVLTRFERVRHLMFRTISQIRVNYESGPLSAGVAGAVKGGDRLPWVADGPTDNFQALRSVDWQIHVYGQTTRAMRDVAQSLGVPMHPFEWTPAAATAGLLRDAAYLVRPDGHVALALPQQNPAELGSYASRHALIFARAAPTAS